MKKLQLNLKPSTQSMWDSMRARPEFDFMPQEGVLVALMRVYLKYNSTTEEVSHAKLVDKDESKRVAFREQRLRRWATMDLESRNANVENFANILTDADLDEFSSEREALDTLSGQYEE